MCGIAGLIHRGSSGDIGAEMTAMLQALKHRGPDSTGFAVYGHPVGTDHVLRFKVAEQEDIGKGFDIHRQIRERKAEVDARIRSMEVEIVDEDAATEYAFRYRLRFAGDGVGDNGGRPDPAQALRGLHRGRGRGGDPLARPRAGARQGPRRCHHRERAIRPRRVPGHPRHRPHADGHGIGCRHPLGPSLLGPIPSPTSPWSTTASSPTTGSTAGRWSIAATASCRAAIPS